VSAVIHDKKGSTSGKKILLYVMALFAIPVAAAVFLYLTGWRPTGAENHGQLIQPVRQIEDRVLQTLDGKSVRFGELRGKWTMVYFGSSSCAAKCLKNLYEMRQVHTGLGKESDRVQRVLIVTDSNTVAALEKKLSDYPGMRVWTGEQTVLSALAQNFGIAPEKFLQNEAIYLIDPMGNLMMRYPQGSDPIGMRKDLTRLLKYSWVG
jgi:cytochrome oxidase Cu insertion factor (SCO1/SenC/PrrC family)